MVNYRRNIVPGGTYFFTVNLANRRLDLLTRHIDLLRQATREVRESRPFDILAVVILPDHLHTLWRLPEDDADFSGRWKAIKSRFTRLIKKHGAALCRNQKGEYRVWQRRFWEHTIRDDNDLNRHIDYIHYNPVKHGLVRQVCDWPYSSFHRFVEKGWLPMDWGCEAGDDKGSYGE